MVDFFGSVEAGCDAVLEAIGSGSRPAALEFLDGRSFGAAAAGYPGDAPRRSRVRADGRVPRRRAHHGSAIRAALWRWRDTVHGAVTSLRGGKLSEDVAVPVERLGEALRRLEGIGAAHALETCAWGHAGDGNMPRDVSWSRRTRLERAEGAAHEVLDMAVELGGTVSGEHGLGWP